MYSLKNFFRNIFGYPKPATKTIPLEQMTEVINLWNDLSAAKEGLRTAYNWHKSGQVTTDSVIGRAAKAYEILDKWVK
jgi:hypothetical protein